MWFSRRHIRPPPRQIFRDRRALIHACRADVYLRPDARNVHVLAHNLLPHAVCQLTGGHTTAEAQQLLALQEPLCSQLSAFADLVRCSVGEEDHQREDVAAAQGAEISSRGVVFAAEGEYRAAVVHQAHAAQKRVRRSPAAFAVWSIALQHPAHLRAQAHQAAAAAHTGFERIPTAAKRRLHFLHEFAAHRLGRNHPPAFSEHERAVAVDARRRTEVAKENSAAIYFLGG
mmetsp:Transcript_11649/g.28299  ORF Transcript_11649/g.28299 Transcript_11649/m.28299 type:complete len:230 (+) Transcript_11649:597-1286(+)